MLLPLLFELWRISMINLEDPILTAKQFAKIQDKILQVDNVEMAILLSIGMNSKRHGEDVIRRFRNPRSEMDAVPGTVATLLWWYINSDVYPPWIPSDLADRIDAAKGEYRKASA